MEPTEFTNDRWPELSAILARDKDRAFEGRARFEGFAADDAHTLIGYLDTAIAALAATEAEVLALRAVTRAASVMQAAHDRYDTATSDAKRGMAWRMLQESRDDLRAVLAAASPARRAG